VGYISARIIQLGYIQQGVTVQQEVRYATWERTGDNYNNMELKAMMIHKQNTFLYRAKGSVGDNRNELVEITNCT